MKRNLVEHAIVEGGSTITQQTAKLLLARRRPAQARGAARARCRKRCSRSGWSIGSPSSEILALYLNLAAYGNQVVGAGRASYAYFGHDASMLTPAQAAFLAGPAAAPDRIQSVPRPDVGAGAAARRAAADAGGRSDHAGPGARGGRRAPGLHARAAPFAARHFVETSARGVGGATRRRIETTLDAGLQAEVAGIISSQRAVLDAHRRRATSPSSCSTTPRGEWLAWEGSGDYFDRRARRRDRRRRRRRGSRDRR